MIAIRIPYNYYRVSIFAGVHIEHVYDKMAMHLQHVRDMKMRTIHFHEDIKIGNVCAVKLWCEANIAAHIVESRNKNILLHRSLNARLLESWQNKMYQSLYTRFSHSFLEIFTSTRE